MVRAGIDLERIERFSFGQKPGRAAFYQRVFTPIEQVTFGQDPVCLALCYTAKEAVSKVLGTGLAFKDPSHISCHDIEIQCGPGMVQPEVSLKRQAQVVARELNLVEIVLSWHHDRSLACAVAVGGVLPEVIKLQVALQQSLREMMVSLHPVELQHLNLLCR